LSQQPTLDEEQRLWALGYRAVAGLDEAGRGAWAGPVVAAAVVLPEDDGPLAEVRDSKLLSPRRRERCYQVIVEHAICYGVGCSSAHVIDRIGIVPATKAAMVQAIAALGLSPDHLLIDAVRLDTPLPQKPIIKGDRTCLSIAAASIIAKVTRDRWMVALDQLLPGYELGRHKGYGTRRHRESLQRLGPTALHRHTFRPIREMLESSHV